MKKLLLLIVVLIAASWQLQGQEDITYQKPPKEILELADFERAPTLMMDSKRQTMILLYRNTYSTIQELSEEEMKLAGLRINPKTNISSGISYSGNIKYKPFNEREAKQVNGLPQNPRLSNFSWSPDESKIAFTHTTETGVELWVFDIATGKADRLTNAILNANLGTPFSWFRDGKALLVKTLPKDKPALINTDNVIPGGPTVSVSEEGEKAQNVTYQDLLKNSTDEVNFENLITAELHKVALSGNMTQWKSKDMYVSERFSPDGNYIMITTVHRPFSYIVPYSRFPMTTTVYDAAGNKVIQVNERPLLEVLPKGMMATEAGKRNIAWRSDKPATLFWVEALDGGDPEKNVAFRDEIFEWNAPFSANPNSLAKTINRYNGILWANDKIAVVTDRWWSTRNTKSYVINPSDSKQQPEILFDRSYEEIYGNPGSFYTSRNEYGLNVIELDGDNACLIGEGYSAEGQFPFIDQINLKTKRTTRLYQSNYTDKKLDIASIIDARQGIYLVSLQSQTEYPNYYILNTRRRVAPMQVTWFENPFKSLEGVYKEVIKYQRSDGVELTGTLYLPADYDRQKKQKLPLVMWAYPTEYKDRASAGQSRANPNEFTYPSYGSPVYWVTRGYAILDNAAFPIVGEGNAEPNDTFIEQLVDNAKAAIDAVDALGYIDRARVAVGGHSYGGFMTANLLTHSDLFAAGIARSGAYNRTLTPFGFQREERNYWEAPHVYTAMSPFQNADKMKYPLLLIHGANDNNTGTYTMQSERYFNALKGLGAPTRLVLLPKESHGYAAKESVLHVLWEQDQWLEKYVKNKK